MSIKSEPSQRALVSSNKVREDETGEVPAQAEPLIECPPELGAVAKQEWDRLVPHLAKAGVLTDYDRGPLAIYCTAYAYWLEATEALQKFGSMVKSPNGYPVQSPWVSIANKQADLMMRIAAEFGFTPASRGRRWMLNGGDSGLLEMNSYEAPLLGGS